MSSGPDGDLEAVRKADTRCGKMPGVTGAKHRSEDRPLLRNDGEGGGGVVGWAEFFAG